MVKPGEFSKLLEIPEENWYADHVAGRELSKGYSEAVQKKLEHLDDYLEPGKLPPEEDAKWRDILGLDQPATKSNAQQQQGIKGNTNKTPQDQAPTTENERPRPLRRGKQRSYADSSFEGYKDAFDNDGSDDEPLAATYGTKDGGGKKGRQVRKTPRGRKCH